jgi:hypothetical protein
MELRGLQDYTLIEQITVTVIMDDRVLCTRAFSYKDEMFLTCLINNRGGRANDIGEGRKFRCTVYAGGDDFRAYLRRGAFTVVNYPETPSHCIEVPGMDLYKKKTVEFGIKFFEETGMPRIKVAGEFL